MAPGITSGGWHPFQAALHILFVHFCFVFFNSGGRIVVKQTPCGPVVLFAAVNVNFSFDVHTSDTEINM